MKTYTVSLVLILVAALLGGCGAAASSPAAEATEGGVPAVAIAGDSEERTLPDSSQLALGTLKLEGTAHAVTPEQASALLPLWQAVQSGGLQNETETAAVLKQIQRAMTAEQLADITAMELTAEALAAWMQEQGMDLAPPDAAAGSGRPAPPEGMSEDDMAAMRATAQAGGEMPGGGAGFGAPGDLSEEERAAMRATAEAGGMTLGGGGRAPAGAGGQLAMMAQQVIEMLTARAAE